MENNIKVGTTFYHITNKNLIYTITKIDDDNVESSWDGTKTFTHSLNSALFYIKNGSWIITTKEKTMEKKIIGYKLIKPEYKEAVIKICNYSVFDFKRFEIEVSEGAVEHLQKAGVLDLWFEPVYKEDKIEIGGYEVKINSFDIQINNVTYGKGQLLDLRTLMKKGQIKSLNVGCSGQYNVDLELLEKIIDKF
jgi:hypothetical protein